ncbi:MAG: tRNA pseudouridine(55) synthase TruB [Bacteroidia bacterium]|nr:tRNA pseudouridine(55) synthase TruB [Bacteroidia bacterium]
MIKYLSNNIEDYPEGIVLPIDKPYRWTSADVIRKVKFAAIRHFGKKNLKVGHAGTLDPLATGILLVCLGPATKRAEELQRSAKQYVAGVTFGATTPSYDLEKDIDREYPLDGVSEESVRGLLPRFIGEQDQVAPLFSAKSVDGVRAYETARKLYKAGQLTEENNILQANRINIYDLELLSFDTPSFVNSPAVEESKKNRINVADISEYALPTAMIKVDCSKGTYIRALARDLGEALGSGAFLSSLRRTANGGFSISEALTLDEVLALLN